MTVLDVFPIASRFDHRAGRDCACSPRAGAVAQTGASAWVHREPPTPLPRLWAEPVDTPLRAEPIAADRDGPAGARLSGGGMLGVNGTALPENPRSRLAPVSVEKKPESQTRTHREGGAQVAAGIGRSTPTHRPPPHEARP